MGVREIFATNVMEHVRKRWPYAKSEEEALKKLASQAGVDISTLRRIVRPQTYSHATTITRADEIARALRCETYKLFVPPDLDISDEGE